MAWTQDDLTRIERAIASGTTRVKFRDREVQYASLSELMAVRNMIREELGQSKSKTQFGEYNNDL
jgi:hypothetical protein